MILKIINQDHKFRIKIKVLNKFRKLNNSLRKIIELQFLRGTALK